MVVVPRMRYPGELRLFVGYPAMRSGPLFSGSIGEVLIDLWELFPSRTGKDYWSPCVSEQGVADTSPEKVISSS